MATYKYKAKRMNGTEVTATTEAADSNSLIERLRGEGLYVYQVKQKENDDEINGSARISMKRIAFFCSQISTMLHVGIPLIKALTICRDSSSDKHLKAALSEISERVLQGQALSQAMMEMSHLFPSFLIFMIETGETSGTLDQIMERMARHYEQEVQLKGKIQTVLIYPAILGITAVSAVVFMLTMVLPQFAELFTDVELPFLTRMFLQLGVFLNHYGLITLIGIGMLICLTVFLFSRKRIRLAADRWLLTIPIVGQLVRTVYTSRFAAAFAILYGSGTGVLKCLEISGRVLGNRYVSEKLMQASSRLREGEMLSEALRQTGVFQMIFISMVLVGEESGSLEQVLADTGDFYEREATTAITQLIALLEPILILVMGGIIGSIVLAIMLPIFQTYGSMM